MIVAVIYLLAYRSLIMLTFCFKVSRHVNPSQHGYSTFQNIPSSAHNHNGHFWSTTKLDGKHLPVQHLLLLKILTNLQYFFLASSSRLQKPDTTNAFLLSSSMSVTATTLCWSSTSRSSQPSSMFWLLLFCYELFSFSHHSSFKSSYLLWSEKIGNKGRRRWKFFLHIWLKLNNINITRFLV